ncbi:SPOR domain-containing protein [Caldimonas brevitalea]|uniref:DedD protein n=1 Tax=Caldimonas brevitalea TaxID=413882 RepID=A0A0G3BLQ8_9BURK|nr:SPOR domain-containing protein [Caldimonas brevitalea]AKJ28286.1 DedD protein [Caldimonas brevitalea]
MGLLSFFKRSSADAAVPPPSGATSNQESIEQARTRARHRLIGAAVLVGLGVIGFPILFETQPRPISVDLPIDIPKKEVAPALVVPPAPPVAKPVTPQPAEAVAEPADARREDPPPAAERVAQADPVPPPPAASAQAQDEPRAEAKPEPKPEPKPDPKPKPEAKPTPPPPKPEPPKPAGDAARAQALLEGRDTTQRAEAAKPAADGGRFIVQVGAYGGPDSAREARQKVERLGLKTYTQVVETSDGKRIRVRVGPFASRAEAEQAAGKIKAAGLPSALLAL